ncbi:hypothetical protein [uncultured Treponema sp.]|uniref:hypothetical protein n=1 Tax=uncultured Treponema sp. TaxID=162155 RepID=UPI0025CD099F|nr:hypothetical protein [uncultured Treponema sp.]
MTIETWPSNVNSNFFAFSEKPKDNTKKTEYLSGRVTSYQINTRNVMTFSCSLQMSKEELSSFWTWYNDELGGLSGVFSCTALGTKNYRFAEIPEPQDTNQLFRVLSMNIEEAY